MELIWLLTREYTLYQVYREDCIGLLYRQDLQRVLCGLLTQCLFPTSYVIDDDHGNTGSGNQYQHTPPSHIGTLNLSGDLIFPPISHSIAEIYQIRTIRTLCKALLKPFHLLLCLSAYPLIVFANSGILVMFVALANVQPNLNEFP